MNGRCLTVLTWRLYAAQFPFQANIEKKKIIDSCDSWLNYYNLVNDIFWAATNNNNYKILAIDIRQWFLRLNAIQFILKK